MSRYVLVLFLLLLTPSLCRAKFRGKDAVDSLLKELPKFGEDSNKVKMLDAIASKFGDSYPDESIKYEREELALAEKLGWKTYIARAYQHLGNDYTAKGDFDTALKYTYRCLSLARNADGIAQLHTNIAKLYEFQKKYDSSLPHYENALKIYDTMNSKGQMAEMLLYISYIYKLQGDYQKTLDNSYKMLEVIKPLGKDGQGLAAAIVGVIGEAYLGMAQESTKTEKPNQWVARGKKANLDSAVKYLEKGVADNGAFGNFGNVKEFSKLLSAAYIQSGNYKKAYETMQRDRVVEDSIKEVTDKDEGEMREMVNQMNESQISLEKKQLATERKARVLFIAGIGLLVLLMAFVFKNFNDQKKSNKVIAKEKEEISLLKNEIEERHKHTIDSVNYARRIQTAILPSMQEISLALPDSFVIMRPKDIVSGDFYWFSEKGGKVIIAAVDCTGHGVPGAFMSMIGNTLLNEIVNEKGVVEPGAILNSMDHAVKEALKQNKEGSDSRDGMDVAICVLDKNRQTLEYAGANRPFYFFAKAETGGASLTEYKPNKFAIGGFDADQKKKFTTQIVPLHPGDTFYIFTDGYADQFGGKNGKKLMTTRFKEILTAQQKFDMQDQKNYLDRFIEEWMGKHEQVDDVLVIGVRV